MMNLFLDDERIPYSTNDELDAYYYSKNLDYVNLEWVIVRTYEQFIDHIKLNGLPQLISFDHDLADEYYQHLLKNNIDYSNYEEKTGMLCVKWLCDYCIDNQLKIPKCLFHTQNLTGKVNMFKYIENYKKIHE
jgi:hypothetical protein